MCRGEAVKRRQVKIPKKVVVRLGRARRLYVERLMARGLSGDTPSEVVDTIFCRGLQKCVPAEWMREVVEAAGKKR
jgi:hypothetical protein